MKTIADARAQFPPAQCLDRVHIREHTLLLLSRLIADVREMDELPVTTETNLLMVGLRDRLADLVEDTHSLLRGGGE